MARLVDVSATMELEPIAGGAEVLDFSGAEPQTEFRPQPPGTMGGCGARLDRSLELVDWFSLIDAA
jgi:hypothetical protein